MPLVSHLYKSNVQFNVTIKMSRREHAGIIPIDLLSPQSAAESIIQSFLVCGLSSPPPALRDVNRSPAVTLDILQHFLARGVKEEGEKTGGGEASFY